jgi:RNA polymerase sigma-70 factor (ECF subfamily)
LAASAAREDSDGPAFTALVARYQQRVWRICFRLLGDEHDASDAAQEVFVRLFLHRGRFAGRSKYSTWVHGVAVRTCLTLRRGRSRRQRREAFVRERSADAAPTGAPSADGSESLDLSQMLDTLEEDERAMLILKYAEGHSYDDLAEMFDLSVSACKMRVLRARERLKQRFPEHEF